VSDSDEHTLAHYVSESMRAVKSFTVQAAGFALKMPGSPWAFNIKIFTAVINSVAMHANDFVSAIYLDVRMVFR
jgi:hypothetical protein